MKRPTLADMAESPPKGRGTVAGGAQVGEQRLTRRTFVGGAAATAGGGALARGPDAEGARKRRKQRRRRIPRADVIVVGAGIGGLVAAREIQAKGHSFYVLE